MNFDCQIFIHLIHIIASLWIKTFDWFLKDGMCRPENKRNWSNALKIFFLYFVLELVLFDSLVADSKRVEHDLNLLHTHLYFSKISSVQAYILCFAINLFRCLFSSHLLFDLSSSVPESVWSWSRLRKVFKTAKSFITNFRSKQRKKRKQSGNSFCSMISRIYSNTYCNFKTG